MNKQALLDELAVKFYKLGKVAPVALSPTDVAIREEEDVTWYIAGVYEKADDRLIRKNVSFYVEADGKPEEAAFYAEKLPDNSLTKVVETPFKDLVITEIDKKVTSKTLLKGIIDSINEESEFAIVTAYQILADEVTTKKYFIYNDVEKQMQFKMMSTTDTTTKEI